MDFADAMRAVLSGKRVRRLDWGRPHFIEWQTHGEIRMLCMVMRDGRVGPYTPSGCDMGASDWTDQI